VPFVRGGQLYLVPKSLGGESPINVVDKGDVAKEARKMKSIQSGVVFLESSSDALAVEPLAIAVRCALLLACLSRPPACQDRLPVKTACLSRPPACQDPAHVPAMSVLETMKVRQALILPRAAVACECDFGFVSGETAGQRQDLSFPWAAVACESDFRVVAAETACPYTDLSKQLSRERHWLVHSP